MPPLLADETSFLGDLAKSSPGLAVAVILVIVFLRALDKRDARADATAEKCHASHDASTKVIQENSVAYGKVCEVLDGQRQAIADAVRDGFEKAASRG